MLGPLVHHVGDMLGVCFHHFGNMWQCPIKVWLGSGPTVRMGKKARIGMGLGAIKTRKHMFGVGSIFSEFVRV